MCSTSIHPKTTCLGSAVHVRRPSLVTHNCWSHGRPTGTGAAAMSAPNTAPNLPASRTNLSVRIRIWLSLLVILLCGLCLERLLSPSFVARLPCRRTPLLGLRCYRLITRRLYYVSGSCDLLRLLIYPKLLEKLLSRRSD